MQEKAVTSVYISFILMYASDVASENKPIWAPSVMVHLIQVGSTWAENHCTALSHVVTRQRQVP